MEGGMRAYSVSDTGIDIGIKGIARHRKGPQHTCWDPIDGRPGATDNTPGWRAARQAGSAAFGAVVRRAVCVSRATEAGGKAGQEGPAVGTAKRQRRHQANPNPLLSTGQRLAGFQGRAHSRGSGFAHARAAAFPISAAPYYGLLGSDVRRRYE
jgi:hypothetical protein